MKHKTFNGTAKLAAVLVSGGLRDFKKMMDAGEVGGTPLIGISKPVIKAHGSSDAFAIKNAIRQAKTCVENDLCGTMEKALAETTAAAAAERPVTT